MKLYYFPNACSLAIHVLLEEIGKPYELQIVDFAKNEQRSAEYLAINPKAKVPALQRDDGTLLTELPAIAWYLARTNLQAGLLPSDIDGEARVQEIIDYLIATVHMRGFTRVFRPEAFSPTPEDKEKVQEAGREMIRQSFGIVAGILGEQDYLVGSFSIADIVLFFLEFWAVRRVGLTLEPALAGHLARMMERPAVQRTLAHEGLS